jgi:hypothetical protein
MRQAIALALNEQFSPGFAAQLPVDSNRNSPRKSGGKPMRGSNSRSMRTEPGAQLMLQRSHFEAENRPRTHPWRGTDYHVLSLVGLPT